LDQLNRLAKGNAQREALFGQLASLYDKMKGLEKQLADLKKAEKKDDAKIAQLSQELAQTRIDYGDAKGRIEQSNMSVADLDAILESQGAERAQQLADLKKR